MGQQVIDADGHVEPAIVAEWRRRVGGEPGRRIDRAAQRWFDQVGFGSSTRRGAWDPVARLADMDAEGIDAAVLFGSSRGVDPLTEGDPELGPLVARAFNDWLAEYCATDPARLRAAAWIAPSDVEVACEEARRAVQELGAVGVVLPAAVGTRPVDDPDLDPLHELCQQLDVPLLLHGIGDLGGFPGDRYRTHLRRHAIAFPVSLMMASMELVCGGVLERYPQLRVGLLEGGAGWVPWWIDRLDEHVELQPFAAPTIEERPSALVARYVAEGRLFWSFEPEERQLASAVEAVGAEAFVYASDYPHLDCAFPESVRLVRDEHGLAEPTLERLLVANARSLYGSRLDA